MDGAVRAVLLRQPIEHLVMEQMVPEVTADRLWAHLNQRMSPLLSEQ